MNINFGFAVLLTLLALLLISFGGGARQDFVAFGLFSLALIIWLMEYLKLPEERARRR